jgi:RND family efflux transporter MFP subunit
MIHRLLSAVHYWFTSHVSRFCSLFIVHCSLFILVACSPPGANIVPTFVPPPAYSPPPGTTYTVEYGDVAEVIEARGRVVAKQEAPLMFPVGGTLKAVHVSLGDTVEEGALLAELEAPGSQEDALQAQLNLLAAEAQLEAAELRLEDLELEMAELLVKPVVPPVDVELRAAQIAFERRGVELRYAQVEFAKLPDRAWEGLDIAETVSWTLRLNEWNYQLAELQLEKIQYDRAQAWRDWPRAQETLSRTIAIQQLQVDVARIGLERARLQSAKVSRDLLGTVLTAPLSGIVASIEKHPGDQVVAHESIGTIADSSELRIVATVLEEDIDRITIGQSVSIQLDVYPNQVYTGTVLHIVSQATVWQGKTAYGVTVAFEEGQPDVPEITRMMGADVRIAGRSRENVLLVPSQAILTIGGREYVEVVGKNGDIERAEIHTGITNGAEMEVVDGLEAGQEIRIP